VIFKHEKAPFLWYSGIVEKPLPQRRGAFPMINENHSNEQLPNELSAVFSELKLSKHLRQAGIRKALAFHVLICFSLFLL
jgi:hypothetical protein